MNPQTISKHILKMDSHYTWTIQDDDCKALHLSVQLLLFFENLVLLF